MRKKKTKRIRQDFTVLLFSLSGLVFVLIVYLTWTTDRLIKIQAANAEAAAQVTLPVVPAGASCGT